MKPRALQSQLCGRSLEPAGTIANPVAGTWKVVESVCINSTSNCNQATSPFFSQ
jgi:hypothetical protein